MPREGLELVGEVDDTIRDALHHRGEHRSRGRRPLRGLVGRSRRLMVRLVAGWATGLVAGLVAGLLMAEPRRAPAVDLLAPGVLLARGEPERAGHVPDRRAGTVGDDVGDLGGVLPAVLGVDVLDDLLAAVGLDVQVDVRRPVALR